METRTQTNKYNKQQSELDAVVDRLIERVENRHLYYENVKRASIAARKEEKARKRQEKYKETGSWKEHKYELPKELELPEDQPKVNKWEFIERANKDMILWKNKDNGCKSCFYKNINPNSIPGKDKDGKPCYNHMNAVGVERNVNNYGKFESLDD